MKIVLFGPPGVGKGTQAALIKEKFNIPHISTGDILRQAVGEGTNLGKQAKHYIDKGELVPDSIVINLVKEMLESGECDGGFILDGFPRTVAQAEALNGVFEELGITLDAVIYIHVKKEDLIDRLSNRWTCRDCKSIFNSLDTVLPDDNSCPKCGGALFQRDDDKPEIIIQRLEVYETLTGPVRQYYEKKGLFRQINSDGIIKNVFAMILNIVGK